MTVLYIYIYNHASFPLLKVFVQSSAVDMVGISMDHVGVKQVGKELNAMYQQLIAKWRTVIVEENVYEAPVNATWVIKDNFVNKVSITLISRTLLTIIGGSFLPNRYL